MTDDARLDDLVHATDLDGLLDLVRSRAHDGDWPGLLRLRDACRAAVRTGRQLWPAATLAEYRLALDAPGPWAAQVLTEEAGHVAVGPLPEVAASSHAWDELAPFVEPGPRRSIVAHECVVRGEDLAGDESVDPAVLDLPLVLQAWEPRYALAVYEAERVDFPAPPLPALLPQRRARAGRVVDDDEAATALVDLVRPWLAESNGRADVVAVEGDALAAVAALGPPAVRMAPVTAVDALAWMAWAGASGGAHGRRRGAASGRFGAWWALAALAGLLDAWPVPPDDLGEVAGELQWFLWDAGEPPLGWHLRLAVADPAEGLAWAISATDAV